MPALEKNIERALEQNIERAAVLRKALQLTEAMAILLDLHKQSPLSAKVNYELAGIYDCQGLEEDAIPFYERAIELGLRGDDLRGCLLGLGSSYRCLEQYSDAVRILEKGLAAFPDAEEFKVFLALSFYNLGEHREAVSLLLTHIGEHTAHKGVKRYQRSILNYAMQPDPPYND